MHAKILLVDDVKVFLEVQKEFLRPSPVRVLTASNGAEALESAREEKPDLVVMDVEMPVMDGITCCAAIKEDPCLSSTPVILLSSNGSHEVIESSQKARCDSFLHKPLFGRDFLNIVHSFLPIIERRRPRVPCRVPVTVQVGRAVFQSISRTISLSGICLETDREVELESETTVSFKLPNSASDKTVAWGRVAWVNPPRNPQSPDLPSGFAVEFREIIGEGESHLRLSELSEFINCRVLAG